MSGKWQGYMGGVYPISRLTDFFKEAIEDKDVQLIRKQGVEYFNIPSSFDIETTSFIDGEDEIGNSIKCATMYIWQFGLNGSVIYGRTWEEFGRFLEELVTFLGLCDTRVLIIYVHNLGYEFQFIRNYFEWDKVFAIKQRRPVYATCEGLEFRCSYFLSNYALAYIGDNLLTKYPVKKLVGNLDYSKMRHSGTPLTPAELDYCINDVRVVMSYIQEKIEQDGDITCIPLTNTGYVRNYTRAECFYEGIPETSPAERKKTIMNYHAIMKSLQIQSEDEYNQLQRAFMGGFTHASCLYSGQIMYNVGSADLTSSYPYTICAQYFPMTKAEFIGTINDEQVLRHYLDKYCCIFDVEFTNLRPRVDFENVLSESRCHCIGEKLVNNGRIVSVKGTCVTTLTELDFDTVCKFYKWDSIRVFNLRLYHRGYLPKALILAVLKLYEDKTTLKGVAGKEIEYLVSKNMINSVFGMMVTAIIRSEFFYDPENGWAKADPDVISQLTKYNSNFNRFLFYGWGVWVTAHARHNLFSAIYEFGADYIYSDTDSIKGINFDDHKKYFEDYNNKVFDNLLKMCNWYNIPFNKCRPKTQKGVEKLLGVWDIEEGYKVFKTVGAKRYLYVNPDDTLNMTVAGLNKKFAVPFLLYEYGGGKEHEQFCTEYLYQNNITQEVGVPAFIQIARMAYAGNKNAMQFILSLKLDYVPIFGYFGDGLFIPAGHTGKQTLTYIDHGFRTILTDYMGISRLIEERSAIYMQPQFYLMSQLYDYIKFLEGIQYVEF